MSKFDIKNYVNPHITTLEDFNSQYKESIQNPSSFFLKKAISYLSWFQEPTIGHNESFEEPKWFEDGILNISYNCIDRHAKKNPEKIAIIWQGDQESNSKEISYQELLEEVSKLANGLKSLGVKKGDRVCIYMPMIPEAAYSMFACMRIGAIHSVVFGGFLTRGNFIENS